MRSVNCDLRFVSVPSSGRGLWLSSDGSCEMSSLYYQRLVACLLFQHIRFTRSSGPFARLIHILAHEFVFIHWNKKRCFWYETIINLTKNTDGQMWWWCQVSKKIGNAHQWICEKSISTYIDFFPGQSKRYLTEDEWTQYRDTTKIIFLYAFC